MVITSAEKKRDDNFSNSNDDEDYKKIKISKPDKYYSEWEKFKL